MAHADEDHTDRIFGVSFVWPLAAASAVVLIASAIECADVCTSYVAWAVAAGTVSLFFCLAVATLQLFSPGLASKVSPGLSTLLFLWWIPGAFVLTFKSPFTTVGNGYFGSWAAFLLAVHYFQKTGLPLFTSRFGGAGHKAGTAANQATSAV